MPISELIPDHLENLRLRGGILTVEQLAYDIDNIGKRDVLFDKIVLKRLMGGVDYLISSWEGNTDANVVRTVDKDVLRELIVLLKEDYRLTDQFSRKFGKEILTVLEDKKAVDFAAWKEGHFDYERNKILDQSVLENLIDNKEEIFISTTFERNRNSVMLSMVQSKEDSLKKLMIKQFEENKMDQRLVVAYKNEQKVILKKVDDPFEIDMKSIHEQTANVVLNKWKESKVDADVYIACTNLSALVFDKNPTEDIQKEAGMVLIQQFKRGEMDPEHLKLLDKHLESFFVNDIEAIEDQYQRAAATILSRWRLHEFVSYEELKTLVLAPWFKRKEFIGDFLDPRKKFDELTKLKTELNKDEE